MNKTALSTTLFLTFFSLALSGCTGKVEEKTSVEESKVSKEKKEQLISHPRYSKELKKWIDEGESRLSDVKFKKIKAHAGKYSPGEIVRGYAVRPKPSYWDNLSDKDKLMTISIMNTGLSQARIDTGYAKKTETLNAILYLEDEKGKIIAVSHKDLGGQLFHDSGDHQHPAP